MKIRALCPACRPKHTPDNFAYTHSGRYKLKPVYYRKVNSQPCCNHPIFTLRHSRVHRARFDVSFWPDPRESGGG